MFQLYGFFIRVAPPVGLKGPCSTKAPSPTDEQPGPTKEEDDQVRNTLKTQRNNGVCIFILAAYIEKEIKITSIEPDNKRFRSRARLCFNKIVKQRSLGVVIYINVACKLLEADTWLPRQTHNFISHGKGLYCTHENNHGS